MIRNHYGIEMGTSTLIVQAQSREEIFADKILAFALRPNRIKNRDIWDIGWLKQNGVEIALRLIPAKVADHHRSITEFLQLLQTRCQQLSVDPVFRESFTKEMTRFLPRQNAAETVEKEDFWKYLTQLINQECRTVMQFLAD